MLYKFYVWYCKKLSKSTIQNITRKVFAQQKTNKLSKKNRKTYRFQHDSIP